MTDDHDRKIRNLLNEKLPQAPENPFLESRIWRAIEDQQISQPSMAQDSRLFFGGLTFGKLTSGLGMAAAVLIVAFLQPLDSQDTSSASPVIAASPTVFSAEEELLEGLSAISSEGEEEVLISAFYDLI